MNKSYYLVGPANQVIAGPFKKEESAQLAQVLHPDGEIRDSEEMQAAADAHSCYNSQEYSDDGPYGPGSYCTECGKNIWYHPL